MASSKEPHSPVLVFAILKVSPSHSRPSGLFAGESLARHRIVTVTLNYRTNVFGFFAHPNLTRESPHHASGNYGLLDQVAALEWVRRNIAAFRGDPGRVTIAGESAGSIAVSALM